MKKLAWPPMATLTESYKPRPEYRGDAITLDCLERLRDLPAHRSPEPWAIVSSAGERRFLVSQGFHPGRIMIAQPIQSGGESARRIMEGID